MGDMHKLVRSFAGLHPIGLRPVDFYLDVNINARRYKVLSHPDTSGAISDLHIITLDFKSQALAGIPPSTAHHYVFAYPHPSAELFGHDQVNADLMQFLRSGGFIYFNNAMEVVQVLAICPENLENEQKMLWLSPPLNLPLDIVSELEAENRFELVGLRPSLASHCTRLAWILPNEKFFSGNPLPWRCNHGSLAYVDHGEGVCFNVLCADRKCCGKLPSSNPSTPPRAGRRLPRRQP
eukprot:NODE_2502_length_915_cov_72.685912_g2055_i0.p1 GENE.NODE_2502_length_915_cov_72.685912_g2055_i0~~NODE_2502_length_915_cov_72.685912_g2055_i0.p1  ORF type:complete len:245 (-),score=72.32 NODE_2502_length_915_cov_72.685912_g2055_i0:180-890(-)